MTAKRRKGSAPTTLSVLVQTHVLRGTAEKLSAKAARLGYKEAAYVRRLIQLDLGEIAPEEN